jgi:DNA-directed RNA polymerase specialized sigma24 family protein
VARAVDKRVCDTSYRQMAEKFGQSKNTWNRALHNVRTRLSTLENSAISRLEPAFVADGLVGAFG